MPIALDTSVNGGTASATSLTFAHTCTGTNLMLFVAVQSDSDGITGVTYNGVPMSRVTKNTTGNSTGILYIYSLFNPTTGANNVIISASSSMGLKGMAISYTGVRNMINAFSIGADSGVGSGTWAGVNVTTTIDNCWALMFACKTFTEVPSAQNGWTTRQSAAAIALIDFNAAITPAGAAEPRVAHTGGSQNYAYISVAFAPDVPLASKNMYLKQGFQ